MIVNGQDLVNSSPINALLKCKYKAHGVSYGLTEAGYDIRIKQDILFIPFLFITIVDGKIKFGNFILASAFEKFNMPNDLVGVVHDKSSWARKGLSVFNTVIEPGWTGYLTLELVYHGLKPLRINKGSGIAQVLFSKLSSNGYYKGKYQNQENKPVEAIYD